MNVDAHQHFWRIADREGQWPPASLEAIHRDFGPQDLVPHLQTAGIEATVPGLAFDALDQAERK